jgi:drug/metabolite transporter (DMT)-like permease
MMIACCLIHSIYDLVLKLVITKETIWDGNFWIYFGIAASGLILLAFRKDWQKQLAGILKEGRFKAGGLILFSESISIGANFIFNYALLLMPIALVSVISNGMQPFFVLLFGIILTLFIPKMAHETLTKKHLIPKIISILIIFFGTILLNP